MSKLIQFDELEKHKTGSDCWMAIHGKVYDVTKFLPEHPGGEEIMLEYAGMDATTAFEDIGHSQAAREMLDKYVIGNLDGAPVESTKQRGATPNATKEGGGLGKLLIPILIVGAVAYFVKNYM